MLIVRVRLLIGIMVVSTSGAVAVVAVDVDAWWFSGNITKLDVGSEDEDSAVVVKTENKNVFQRLQK